jgi:hypothetical protein
MPSLLPVTACSASAIASKHCAQCRLQLMAQSWHEASLLAAAHALETTEALHERRWTERGKAEDGIAGLEVACDFLS